METHAAGDPQGHSCLDANTSNIDLCDYVANAIHIDPAQQQACDLSTEEAIRNVYVDAPLVQVETETGEVQLRMQLQRLDVLESNEWQPFEAVVERSEVADDKAFYCIFFETTTP